MSSHQERKHSRFSASGASRWFACPGSVSLSEGVPSKDSIWSLEGTRAHEILEKMISRKTRRISAAEYMAALASAPPEMIQFGNSAADFILAVHREAYDAELMVETRVLLDFVHPDAFGSLDAAIVEPFGTLHVLDYKYGKSLVRPENNLQFLFYALAVAHRYDWNFKRVRMWVLQPRVRGFDGFTFWEISIAELRSYVSVFKNAVDRVIKQPNQYAEGEHCHWCPAKSKCPLKLEGRNEKAMSVFNALP